MEINGFDFMILVASTCFLDFVVVASIGFGTVAVFGMTNAGEGGSSAWRRMSEVDGGV